MLNDQQNYEIVQYVSNWLQTLIEHEKPKFSGNELIYILNVVMQPTMFEHATALLEEWEILEHVQTIHQILHVCEFSQNPAYTPDEWFDEDGQCDTYNITKDKLEENQWVIYEDPFDDSYKCGPKGYLNIVRHNTPNHPPVTGEEVVDFINYILISEISVISLKLVNNIKENYPYFKNIHYVRNDNASLTQEALNDKLEEATLTYDLNEIRVWIERGAQVNAITIHSYLQNNKILDMFCLNVKVFSLEFIELSRNLSNSAKYVYEVILKAHTHILEKILKVISLLIDNGLEKNKLLESLAKSMMTHKLQFGDYLSAHHHVNIACYIEILISIDVDINLQTIPTEFWFDKVIDNGNTLLHYACLYGHERLVEQILGYNSNNQVFNVFLKNADGDIPYVLVFKELNTETRQENIAKLFANHPALDKLIFYCIQKAEIDALFELITVEANFFWLNEENQTPLGYALVLQAQHDDNPELQSQYDELIEALTDYLKDKIENEDEMFLEFKRKYQCLNPEISINELFDFAAYIDSLNQILTPTYKY